MGGSSSKSASTYNTTTTYKQASGGSGEFSPAIDASGGSTVKIETGGKEVSLSALDNMTSVVSQALEGAKDFATSMTEFASKIAGNQADSTSTQALNDTSLLQSVLEQNATLAQNSQTGGATAAIKTTNYIVWGLLALAGLAVAFLFWRKS